ncbi:SdpI/YhfL protein family protein [Saccharopolyspora kobensis]|uniref:SdpI/YhfL protein family protein n=1 Tax=Saccharopolyspora kobensis TaxID=146035 RepID=A0A1H6E569_9PSEU|nr:SdpI family protein [Saccharopolyspora kobensis]SEG92777.1 SdpI/YhfL protein family protein [Saccharopolyspora kobensis]SFD40280.1 SdpI/YhfL protein family protein [Saccharopolyspora kobensis]
MEAAGSSLVLALGLVLISGVVHGIQRSVARGNLKRNGMLGIRTKVTMSSDEAWEAGHLAARPWTRAGVWVGCSSAAVTAVIATGQLIAGTGSPILLLLPAAGLVVVVVLLLLGTRDANAAGRAAKVSRSED